MDDTDTPIVGGGPDPVVTAERLAAMNDPIWLALGQPVPQRIYVSTQGDWWDVIAVKAYGFKRGNESLMYRLIENNYPLRDISNFPAGVAVFVPDQAIATEIPLVPWKKASIVPAAP